MKNSKVDNDAAKAGKVKKATNCNPCIIEALQSDRNGNSVLSAISVFINTQHTVRALKDGNVKARPSQIAWLKNIFLKSCKTKFLSL